MCKHNWAEHANIPFCLYCTICGDIRNAVSVALDLQKELKRSKNK